MSDRTVKVRLEAIVGQYEQQMAKAGLATKGLAGTVEGLGQRGSAALKSMSGGLVDVSSGTAAAIGAAVVAGGALLKFATDGVDAYVGLVEAVDAYQDVTGASAEESSRMVAIAQAYGVEVDTLAQSMFKLSRNVSDHADVLEADGIVIARNKDGQVDLSATLGNVADAYKRAGAGTEGNRIAQEAFGKGGLKLIDILERTHEELDGVTKAAEEHGRIMSDEDIQSVVEYRVATKELGDQLDEIKLKLGEKAAEQGTDLARGLVAAVDAAEDLGDTKVGGFVEDIAAAGYGIDRLTSSHGLAAIAAREQAKAEEENAIEVDKAAEAAEKYKLLLDSTFDAAFSVASATGKMEQGLISFADGVRAAQLSGDKWATSLDQTTTEGQANFAAVRDLTKGALDAARAMTAQGVSQDVISMSMVTYRERLLSTLEALHFNRAEAADLVEVLVDVAIPRELRLTANTAEAEDALSRVLALLGMIQRAEHFTNLNVLSGRTAGEIVPTGTGTSLADAVAGGGPFALPARP